MSPLSKLLEVLIGNKGQRLYAYGKTQLGQVKSGQRATIDVGCVEAFENIFFGCFNRYVSEGVHTATLYKALNSSIRFRKLKLGERPELGDIILAVTGQGIGNTRGHVGIISDGWRIMSNNSINGKWDEHLDVGIWLTNYLIEYKMPLHIYRVLY